MSILRIMVIIVAIVSSWSAVSMSLCHVLTTSWLWWFQRGIEHVKCIFIAIIWEDSLEFAIRPLFFPCELEFGLLLDRYSLVFRQWRLSHTYFLHKNRAVGKISPLVCRWGQVPGWYRSCIDLGVGGANSWIVALSSEPGLRSLMGFVAYKKQRKLVSGRNSHLYPEIISILCFSSSSSRSMVLPAFLLDFWVLGVLVVCRMKYHHASSPWNSGAMQSIWSIFLVVYCHDLYPASSFLYFCTKRSRHDRTVCMRSLVFSPRKKYIFPTHVLHVSYDVLGILPSPSLIPWIEHVRAIYWSTVGFLWG